ncbi:MAG: hypothetical protein LUI39_12600 [Lachnospiraceae bacterium]|nr:hypothetical protein [Lachnospiraceae bacterium]
MKKKVFSLLLTATIITCSCVYPVCASEEAADGENGIETSDYYRLGDSISTDIMDFTLDSAQFAIALENTYGDDYLLPKEYDASDDAKNPFVASIGHTLVYFSMIITNNNRTSLNINDTFSDWTSSFVSVIYDDEFNIAK